MTPGATIQTTIVQNFAPRVLWIIWSRRSLFCHNGNKASRFPRT